MYSMHTYMQVHIGRTGESITLYLISLRQGLPLILELDWQPATFSPDLRSFRAGVTGQCINVKCFTLVLDVLTLVVILVHQAPSAMSHFPNHDFHSLTYRSCDINIILPQHFLAIRILKNNYYLSIRALKKQCPPDSVHVY